MLSADSATHQPNAQAPAPRLGLHDAFWSRVLLFFMRWVPMQVFTLLAYPVTAVIYLLAVAPREATATREGAPGNRAASGEQRCIDFAVGHPAIACGTQSLTVIDAIPVAPHRPLKLILSQARLTSAVWAIVPPPRISLARRLGPVQPLPP